MDPNDPSQRQYDEYGRPVEHTFFQKVKKFLAPIGIAVVAVFKFLAPLKFILLPLLKTGGSMIVMTWIYARFWGWPFAAGLVLLIFVHECGHLLAAKRIGLKVGVPVFIPFLGALIALKEAPRNAWIEAQVGIAGPIFGALGALFCELVYLATGNPLFRALAYFGFWLNLFNLMPIGILDGGRVVTALSPWLWLAGFIAMGALLILHPNFLVVLILIVSLPRLWFLFRRKSEDERRYFEVTPAQRWTMAAVYFGLIALLALGMEYTFIPPEAMQ